jgi:transketolase
MKDKGDFSALTPDGRNIKFGIREHAMAGICNGLSLHGGFQSYCATFLVFSDYLKHSIRMSALMGLNVMYIFSHDSIGVGEDGPTHQPVEQLVSLRSIPNVNVWRPADGVEVSAAYASVYGAAGPTCIVTSRQDLPFLENTSREALNGGYVLIDSVKPVPDCILIGSGSEIQLCVKAREMLAAQGVDARIVSMPSMEVFERQTRSYRDGVLPPQVRARLAVEAGSSLCWHRYVGLDGGTVTMDRFGASAPADTLFQIYGFTAENVAAQMKKIYRSCLKKGDEIISTGSDES